MKDWKLGRLNHVAIAVPDLEKAIQLYRYVLGADVSDVVVSLPCTQAFPVILSPSVRYLLTEIDETVALLPGHWLDMITCNMKL